MFNQNKNIVINSNKEIFVFNLSTEREIIYNIYNSPLISLNSGSLGDEKVLMYATLIDEQDTIHLVSLLSTGELNYHKYIDKVWTKNSIAKFDMQSNLYSQIEILMVQDKLHIIYNYSNLINSNIWTIQHVVYNSKEKHNAIRYISKRTPEPFSVDVDSKDIIHLLYKNNITNPQIYHGFYNPYRKSWTSLYKKISIDNVKISTPFLFIDSQDNLHALWLEELNNKYQIRYMKMSSSGKEEYIWKNINLPYMDISNYAPIIIEKDDNLNLVFVSNDNIIYLHSSDQGNSWHKSYGIENLSENTIIAKVKSNLYKANYIYCNLVNDPKLYFLDLILHRKDLESVEELSIEEQIHAIDVELDSIEVEIPPISNEHNITEQRINQILENQEIIKKQLEKIHNSVSFKKISFLEKFFK